MTVQIVTVSNVLSPFPNAVVTVEYGPEDRQQFNLRGWFYEPQIGDQLRIDLGSVTTEPYVVEILTDGRIPNLNRLSLTVQNTTPTGLALATSVYVGTDQIVAVVTPAPPTTSGGASFLPINSHTYDATNGWGRSDNYLRQGAYPGGPPATGLWFYDTADIAAKLATRTLTSVSVTVKRVEGVGSPYAPKPIFVVGHAYAVQPAGVPSYTSVLPGSAGSLGTGDQLTFPLPLAVASALQSGGLLGLGIASAASGDYLACYGAGTPSGRIDVKWSS